MNVKLRTGSQDDVVNRYSTLCFGEGVGAKGTDGAQPLFATRRWLLAVAIRYSLFAIRI